MLVLVFFRMLEFAYFVSKKQKYLAQNRYQKEVHLGQILKLQLFVSIETPEMHLQAFSIILSHSIIKKHPDKKLHLCR